MHAIARVPIDSWNGVDDYKAQLYQVLTLTHDDGFLSVDISCN
jgi:hypothetical protein